MIRRRPLLSLFTLLLATCKATPPPPPSIDHALRELMPATRVEGRTYGRLFMTFNSSRQELVPVDEDAFASVQGGRIHFERDARSRVTTLVLGAQKLPRRCR